MAQLSEGAIKKIYDTGDTTATPTLQVWDVKRIGTAATIPPDARQYSRVRWQRCRHRAV
eukprot:COSAG04_NODE_11995_length_676_cov_88.391681_2_plen_59_part_00